MEYNDVDTPIHISASRALSWLQMIIRDHKVPHLLVFELTCMCVWGWKAKLKEALMISKAREPDVLGGYPRWVLGSVTSKECKAWLKATQFK